MSLSRRLVLVRHAQAADHHPLGDHERVLTEQGVVAAAALGAWLAEQDLVPDHVLVSTARRARQTLAALRTGAGGSVGGPVIDSWDDSLDDSLGAEQVWTERRVYDGGTDGVLAAVHEVPEEARVLWVVGHEPVMSTTAWALADPQDGPQHRPQHRPQHGPAHGPAGVRDRLSRGLPTATAVVLERVGGWADLGPGGARALLLHTGRPALR